MRPSALDYQKQPVPPPSEQEPPRRPVGRHLRHLLHRLRQGLSGLKRFHVVQRLTWLAKFTFKSTAILIASSLLVTAIYGFVPVPATPLMVIRAGESLVSGKRVRFEKDWVSFKEMSPRLQLAMIAAEDWRFFEHNGFDWEAIAKALKHNARSRKIRGASTISQQVAKNVFLWPARSWIRKGLEAYFTVLIEALWSKRRIMEVYLNVIELGDGIYGVEAASRQYFKKPASQLNSAEAALIAAVLPNPRKFLINRPSSYVRFRQSLIQRRIPAASLVVPKH